MGLGIFEDEPDGRGEGCSYFVAIARAKLHASSATHTYRAVRTPHRAAAQRTAVVHARPGR
jgi:hypothetical protein